MSEERIHVVKVQLSKVTNAREQQVLVYDENREYMWEGAASKQVKEAMGDQFKLFFYAQLLPDGQGGLKFVLRGEAPWQNW